MLCKSVPYNDVLGGEKQMKRKTILIYMYSCLLFYFMTFLFRIMVFWALSLYAPIPQRLLHFNLFYSLQWHFINILFCFQCMDYIIACVCVVWVSEWVSVYVCVCMHVWCLPASVCLCVCVWSMQHLCEGGGGYEGEKHDTASEYKHKLPSLGLLSPSSPLFVTQHRGTKSLVW